MSLAFFTQIKVNIAVCQQHGQYKYISVVTAFIICLNMAFLNFISQNVGNNKKKYYLPPNKLFIVLLLKIIKILTVCFEFLFCYNHSKEVSVLGSEHIIMDL